MKQAAMFMMQAHGDGFGDYGSYDSVHDQHGAGDYHGHGGDHYGHADGYYGQGEGYYWHGDDDYHGFFGDYSGFGDYDDGVHGSFGGDYDLVALEQFRLRHA
jgi:hypothetical protein